MDIKKQNTKKKVNKLNIANKANSKKTKHFLHDHFFKDIFEREEHCLDIFRLVFTEKQFNMFNWNTLKLEVTSFIDKEWKEKRTDLNFSVKLKNQRGKPKTKAYILFILEHKTYQDPSLLLQMLEYQAPIYSKKENVIIIPVVIYQGRKKKWKGALSFHEYLEKIGIFEKSSLFRKLFSKNILNFECIFLNIRDLNISKEVKHLTTRPVLHILKNIWNLDSKKVEEFFLFAKSLKTKKERKELIGRTINYILQYKPDFSWKILNEVEKKVTKQGEEVRTMPLLENFYEEIRKKGIKQGIKQGLKQGIEKGIEKGMEKGREEGREEGMERNCKLITLNMLKEGVDVEFVAKVTGLSKSEIKKLKNGS